MPLVKYPIAPRPLDVFELVAGIVLVPAVDDLASLKYLFLFAALFGLAAHGPML
jgi:hypothetical protein